MMNGFPSLSTALSKAANSLLTIGAERLVSSVAGSSGGGWGIYTSATSIMNGSFADTASSIVLSTVVGEKTLGEWIGTDATSFFDAPDFTSMHSVNSRREAGVLDHPVEGGSFVSYNKVKTPETVNITLTRSGNKVKRKALLDWLERNVPATSLYDIVTPEHVYRNMTLESYELDRQADNGGTSMIMANCSFRQVNFVTVLFTGKNTEGCISSNDSPMSILQKVSSIVTSEGGDVLKKAGEYVDLAKDSITETAQSFLASFQESTNKAADMAKEAYNRVSGGA